MPEPTIATKEVVERIFDEAAPIYDRAGPRLFRQFGARLVDLMELAPGMRVLDVGTGTGAVLIPAAERVGPSGQVVGVDVSNEMLGQADRAVRAAGLSNVQLGRMDAERLEFSDGVFDAIACSFALLFLPNMGAGLREMQRVCCPSGRFGATLWGKTPPPFDPAWKVFADLVRKYGVEVRMPQRVAYSTEDIQTMLSAAGFDAVEIRQETTDLVYTSEEDWWSFQLSMGSRAAILRMPDEIRAQFKEEYLAQLRPLFRSDGLHLPAPVIYALARRP